MTALVPGDRRAPWLDAISSVWVAKPLKYVARINRAALAETTSPGTMIRYIDISSVSSLGEVTKIETMAFGSAPSRARRVVRHGDTIVSTVRTYLRAVAPVPAEDEGLVASTGFAVVTPGPNLDEPFLSYWLRGNNFVDEVCARSVGVSYPATNASEVGAIPVPLPSLPTQKAIADFLDCKTAAIDALVEKKQKLLDLLAEKRAALINQAVTKGLDPRVPMKDSGVPWIGKIPAHWEVIRFKYVALLETGHTPSKSTPEYWVPDECVHPWVSLNDTKTLAEGDYIDDTKVRISDVGMRHSAAHLIETGAIVFNRDGARVGLTSITTKPMAVSQHMIAWVCGPAFSNHYGLYVIYGMRDEIYRLCTGATIPTIGMDDIKGMMTPLPPISEQLAIVENVRAGLHRNCRAVSLVNTQIEKLQEYRQALITAAVTGQLDIPEEAA